MKRKLKIICSAALICAAVTLFTACAKWDTPYQTLDEKGYTVSVRYDANGGVFAGTNDVFVVDVFNSTESKIALIAPDDARRKENAFGISRHQYFLAGWYRTRELRVNEQGQPLDDFGNLCSVSGNPQGYVYADRWDFKNDRLTVDPNTSTSSEVNAMTLYAAWVPYINYEFYAQNPETQQFEKVGNSHLAINLTLPAWNEKTGKLDMNNFPTRDGMTFDKAYLDAEMTQELTDTLYGNFDEEKGILQHSGTVKVYTTWMEGEWFRIYNAKQFFANSKLNGNYILCADLDFSNQTWKLNLTEGEFNGTIIGNGFKISNIKSIQGAAASDRQEFGGLFGSLGANAVIKDVVFENVSYQIEAGTRAPEASFGLFAGIVHEGATLENVTVSGKLLINAYATLTDYNIGLVCGIGSTHIDRTNIQCFKVDGTTEAPITADANGMITLS